MTTALLSALVALLIGSLLGWLLARARVGASLATAASERAAALAQLDGLRDERDRAIASREQAGAEVSRLQSDLSATRSTLDAERRSAEERAQFVKTQLDAIKEQFEAMASKALHSNSEAVVQMAKRQLEHAQKEASSELDKRTTAVQNLVQPLQESLKKVDEKVTTFDTERQTMAARLDAQLQAISTAHGDLQKETAALVTALRKPQTRGQWGEMQLRRVVEFAGMVQHCDFATQETTISGSGGQRPDMIVRLPERRSIVVDAKVSLAAFLEAQEADNVETATERLKAHARHLKSHVDDLASKAYWEQLPDSPEFVVLFVPGESILGPALEHDPTLLDYAFQRRVFIATPTVLIAVLRSVAYLLQQAEVTDNALEIQKLGRDLYKRLATMGGHLDKLGRSLSTSVETYNKAVGSLERNVMTSARRFNELGVTDGDLPTIDAVEAAPRPLTKPELISSAERSRAVRSLSADGAGHLAEERAAADGTDAADAASA
jgi:DNA recombination protein RmuC